MTIHPLSFEVKEGLCRYYRLYSAAKYGLLTVDMNQRIVCGAPDHTSIGRLKAAYAALFDTPSWAHESGQTGETFLERLALVEHEVGPLPVQALLALQRQDLAHSQARKITRKEAQWRAAEGSSWGDEREESWGMDQLKKEKQRQEDCLKESIHRLETMATAILPSQIVADYPDCSGVVSVNQSKSAIGRLPNDPLRSSVDPKIRSKCRKM